MIKKYSVLISLFISVVLIVVAALLYPGGSIVDQYSIGFDWSKNYLSNLFAPKALNGSENPGRIWAVIGMVFHSVGYGLFFINMSKKISSKIWSAVLRFIGFFNLLLIFLIATPLHDLGTFSIILTLLGLFGITVFVLLSKLHFFKFCCILCLLIYYCFFFFYGFGYTEWSVILQKVYVITSILLVLGLEYFTGYEDFNPIKSVENPS